MTTRIALLALTAGLALTLAPALASAATHSSGAGVAISDRATGAPEPATASPYPSAIAVSGESGLVSDLNVTVTGLTHTFVPDIDVLLVGPGGENVLLMSDAAGNGATGTATDVAVTFDDEAAAGIAEDADIATGSYKPTDTGEDCTGENPTEDVFPSPAPSSPYGGFLNAFDGTDPNGTWSLYVVDDCHIDVGSISDWSLDVTTGTPPHEVGITDRGPGEPPATASPYPSAIAVSGETGVISDVNVTLTGLTHTFVPDIDVLLVGPGGENVLLMSDAAGNGATGTATDVAVTFDDEAAAGIAEDADIATGSYKPTDTGEDCIGQNPTEDVFPSPAPSSPYGGFLNAFGGTDPNGSWSLYVVDDCQIDVGSISDWSLDITTETPAASTSCTSFNSAALVLSVSGSSTLAVDGSAIEADGSALASPCDTATTTNTDSITVNGSAGDDTLTIDLSGGAFAPGATDEGDGSSEIEFQVDLDGGTNNDLVVNGSESEEDSDFIYLGKNSGVRQMNLNGDEADGIDADVLSMLGIGTVTLNGGTGDDELIGGGGPGLADPFDNNLTVNGGDGFDALMGGTGNDALDGGAGDGDQVRETADVDFTLSDTSLIGNGTDSLASIERATLAGGPSANTIDASAFTGNVHASGGDEADTLTGGSGDDGLVGEDGDDDLDAGSGSDLLVGGAGTNTLDGGDGLDELLEFGDADYTLTDTALTGVGTDSLLDIETARLDGADGDSSFDVGSWTGFGGGTLNGGGGTDTVIYSNDPDELILSDSALVVFPGPDFELNGIEQATLTGGAGDNGWGINDWTGSATFDGGDGTDNVSAGQDADMVLADSGLSISNGGTLSFTGFETAQLTGGDGDNSFDVGGWTGSGSPSITIDGVNGADTVVASRDSDFTLTDSSLDIGSGGTFSFEAVEAASLTGGDGNNSFDVSDWTSGGGTIDGAGGTADEIVSSNDADFTLTDSSLDRSDGGSFSLSNAEQATLTGGGSDNTFTLTGWSGNAVLDGQAPSSSDHLVYEGDTDFTLTDSSLVVGSGGTVTFTGIEDAMLTGGNSDNSFDVGGWTSGGVALDGASGPDTVVASRDSNFTLSDSILSIGSGGTFSLADISAAVLLGGPANNTFDASAFSGAATVSYASAAGPVKPNLSRGVSTGAGKDSLIGIDNLIGSAFADVLDGDGGANTLDGGGQNDRVNGKAGADTLIGGDGTDSTNGGRDVDTCFGEKFTACEAQTNPG